MKSPIDKVSQIYVRFPYLTKEGRQKSGLLANEYRWNYGKDMISRAKQGIAFLRHPFCDNDLLQRKELLSRTLDVDYDTRSIEISTNRIREALSFCQDTDLNKDIFFSPENNSGQLYLDVSKNGVKYAFTTGERNSPIMNANGYLVWNIHSGWRIPSELCSWERISICDANIREIEAGAKIMTEEELQAFQTTDYSSYFYTYQTKGKR